MRGIARRVSRWRRRRLQRMRHDARGLGYVQKYVKHHLEMARRAPHTPELAGRVDTLADIAWLIGELRKQSRQGPPPHANGQWVARQ